MVEKSRLVMVLSYLESIEDPYQYGDNYGDLVEYLKMLIEGEEEYVPEENKFTLSWMQKNKDGEWEEKSKLVNWEDIRGMDTVDILQSGLLGEATHVKDMRLTESPTRDSWVGHATKDQKGKRVPHPKFIEWVKENAVRPEVTDDGKIIVDKETFEETGSWGYSNKKNPFNFSPKTLKWIEDNAVEPERTKHGIIIEGSFDGEDYLTEEDQAILHTTQIQAILKKLRNQGVYL